MLGGLAAAYLCAPHFLRASIMAIDNLCYIKYFISNSCSLQLLQGL